MKELREERTEENINLENLLKRRWPVSRFERGLVILLCKRDAELGKVFARGGQIIPDDGHVLLDVHDD